MAIYTYADFEQAAKSAGLLNQFSKADLTLAQQNPDAGMSILKYKQDYLNATTDEARAAANAGAEGVRSSWGGYTGGGDGGSFHLDAMSPNDYTYGSAPEYTNRYDGTIQGLLNQVVNREEFSYNPDTDPLASAYKKQYAREGQRATQDTLGAAAAATGGLPSSYAVSAAGQAGNYYASQMADKIPELYQLHYNKYVSDHSMKLSDLGAVQSAEQADYSKYLNQLNQYNTDRNFGYGQYLDEVNNQTLIRQENAALSDTEYQRQLELAQLAASYGDYSGIEALGISPNYAALTSGGKGGKTADTNTDTELNKLMQARIYQQLLDDGYDSKDAENLSQLYTNVNQIPGYNDSSKLTANGKIVLGDVQNMIRRGVPKAEISQTILDYANSGDITPEDRRILINQIRGEGW